VLETDVRQDADNRALVALAESQFGAVDVLMANAGFGVVGKMEDLEIEDYERQFETNFFGVLRTIQAGLPALARSRGRVVLMGSVSGHVSIPGTSAYSASKFAVRALAEALEEELRPRGISVTLLSPGFVESEFRQVDNEGCRHEETPDPVPRRMVMPVQVAARRILRAIERGRRELILTRTGKLVVFLQRHAPWLQRFLFRRLSIESRPAPGAPDGA